MPISTVRFSAISGGRSSIGAIAKYLIVSGGPKRFPSAVYTRHVFLCFPSESSTVKLTDSSYCSFDLGASSGKVTGSKSASPFSRIRMHPWGQLASPEFISVHDFVTLLPGSKVSPIGLSSAISMIGFAGFGAAGEADYTDEENCSSNTGEGTSKED